MSLGDVTSARSSPAPEACPECDTSASVTSDLHKYQVACTCKPSSAQYACADEPGPPPPAKTDTPPALPPRPPASLLAATNRRTNASVGCNGGGASCRRRKYAWWCVGCGALAAALGGLLAAQHILLRAYTASPQHLETVPAAVPAAMLVLTGVCIMSLARRRNRYSYMIKVVGACCLVCALTCVLVTITTTVIHMNKLQTLKFCEYTKLTRTCTCYSMPPDTPHSAPDDEGVRCVFEGVSECGVVHGALYWCLRGVFALSVSAVLVCIFSCMLAYQLLSHERKKMYWEQLELRCRSLYRPASGQAAPSAGRPVQSNCSCCAQCHPGPPAWDISLQHRFWAPGRIGNLYSPNPGAGRKTSAWSWFPWPRTNSQNSRCRMGGASGDSAYGFCENDAPPHAYDERYPTHTQHPQHQQLGGHPQLGGQVGGQLGAQVGGQLGGQVGGQQGGFQRVHDASFAHGSGFAQAQGSFSQGHPNFAQQQAGFPGEGAAGSFDAATGLWGPPPPYSPHGRNNTRSHHVHQAQDPAAATLLQHQHHQHLQHACRPYLQDNRLNPELSRLNPELAEFARLNPEISRLNPELAEFARLNPEMSRLNPELAEFARLNPEISRLNPELAEFARLNPEMSRLNPELSRLNPDLGHMSTMYPDVEMSHLTPDARFSTLRGHLVPYRCQRSLGMSAGNLHRDCRPDEVAIECLHQKSASKVSEQSSDSCQKQGKENLGFQNDKHSPIRSSLTGCGGVAAESEVYFADVSSCCNVSVKAECCMGANVSLVGTIENQPDSSSESDASLPPAKRALPAKRRRDKPRHAPDARDRITERMNETRVNDSRDRMCEARVNDSRDRMNDARVSDRMNDSRVCERMNDSRDRMNEARMSERINERMHDVRISDRMNETRMSERMNERFSDRMNETRLSERMNDSRDRLNEGRVCERIERLNDSRIIDRMNETRMSERMNDSRDRLNEGRVCERIERLNDSRIIDRMNETRMSERMNDSRDRMNETRISERMNDSRDRMNETRMSERINDSRDRMNDSRSCEVMGDPRIERMNDSRISDRMNETRLSERLNDSRVCERMNDSRLERLNDSKLSDRSDTRHGDRLNDSRIERMNDSRLERMSDLNSSIRIDGSPKMRQHISPLRIARSSPKNLTKDHPRQSSSDSNKPDFRQISPLSPNTEESLLSDDDRQPDQVYSNDPETSKCLGPDSQYEPVREGKDEVLKGNHHHCYSDTNTMDSGWQSGSEKQVTD